MVGAAPSSQVSLARQEAPRQNKRSSCGPRPIQLTGQPISADSPATKAVRQLRVPGEHCEQGDGCQYQDTAFLMQPLLQREPDYTPEPYEGEEVMGEEAGGSCQDPEYDVPGSALFRHSEGQPHHCQCQEPEQGVHPALGRCKESDGRKREQQAGRPGYL